uniref:C2H2-type domain-containing protein n=1 Tax=Caenorhabditis japonica TaxID=281687 RepID=A0A8R1DP67_CAEJA
MRRHVEGAKNRQDTELRRCKFCDATAKTGICVMTHTVRDHAHLMIPSELEWYRVQVDRAQRYNTQARIKMGKIFVPEPEPARQQKEAEPDLPRMTPLPPLELPVRRQPAEQHQPRGDWMYVPQYREYVCAYQEY